MSKRRKFNSLLAIAALTASVNLGNPNYTTFDGYSQPSVTTMRCVDVYKKFGNKRKKRKKMRS